eukprot:9419292-Alexandrium_andersonii.AAC.1
MQYAHSRGREHSALAGGCGFLVSGPTSSSCCRSAATAALWLACIVRSRQGIHLATYSTPTGVRGRSAVSDA